MAQTLPRTSPQTPSQFLSLSEAALQSGKSETSIRNWLKSNLIKGQRGSDGCWKIERTSLFAHLSGLPQKSERSAPKVRGYGAESDQTSPQSEPLTLAYREALERERRINDELRSQIKDLEKERTQHLAEMRALLSKDAKATDGVISRWLRR